MLRTTVARSRLCHRRTFRLALLCLTALLVGCAIPQAEVSPEGVLRVLMPTMANAGDGSDGNWVALLDSGDTVSPDHLTITTPNNDTVARAVAGRGVFRVVRRTHVNLLASPFLSWKWRVSRHRGAAHPVRLVVGFFGGDKRFGKRGSEPLAFLGRKLPVHDRSIDVIWGAQALARGTLSTRPARARYTARGGIANTERWWSESIDLARLYHRLWPTDDVARAHIVFIGLAVAAATDLEVAEFKELALHR